MTGAELNRYWLPAAGNLYRCGLGKRTNEGWSSLINLDRLLGVHEYSTYRQTAPRDELPMPEELKQKLILLAGPHANTVVKIIEARKELKHEGGVDLQETG